MLQIPLEHLSLSSADSLMTPYEFGPAVSRGTYAIGSAVIVATEDAKEKLFTLIAPQLQARPEDLDTEDDGIFMKGQPERKIHWKAMGIDRTAMGYGRFEQDYTLSNFMISFVEVEVDTEIGKVDQLRVVNTTDAGKIIDLQGLEGQLNGCLGSACSTGPWES